VDAFLEERVAAGHRSSLRQSVADLNFLTSVVKWPNTISPTTPSATSRRRTTASGL